MDVVIPNDGECKNPMGKDNVSKILASLVIDEKTSLRDANVERNNNSDFAR